MTEYATLEQFKALEQFTTCLAIAMFFLLGAVKKLGKKRKDEDN